MVYLPAIGPSGTWQALAGITSFSGLSFSTFGQFTTITSASGDIIYLRGAGDVAVDTSSIDASDFIFA